MTKSKNAKYNTLNVINKIFIQINKSTKMEVSDIFSSLFTRHFNCYEMLYQLQDQDIMKSCIASMMRSI